MLCTETKGEFEGTKERGDYDLSEKGIHIIVIS